MGNLNFIDKLPHISECKQILKAAAMLDAILMPEWEYRYYSYNSQWDTNEQMASMRDGQGDHYFAIFSPNGLIIKGFDKEYELQHKVDRSDVVKRVPEAFNTFLAEPAFVMDQTTFCIWSVADQEGWSAGTVLGDHEYELLEILVGGAKYYHAWAQDYYEIALDIKLVEQVFDMKPINEDLLQQLNDELKLSDIEGEIAEIGYPDKDLNV
ncbi:hypothetical protein HF638_20990 [Paenibacillus sp. SZ31]|uniref:hypothetical protein n=1 Tax=unclassified Paenibacillus TaxID=185978 RepID=UPI00146A9215|nr:hypothetical protein [Paenibacillus sp. SZ31]NMI06463.1 hypothetical protein [Paenibacillus sp. SZ31]